MQPMYYIGLDVHKRKISYCVKDGSGGIHAEGSIPPTRLDLDHWMRSLPQPWRAAMESTMFTGWIYDHLKPHAAALKVAPPLMLRANRGSEKEERPHRCQQNGSLVLFRIGTAAERPTHASAPRNNAELAKMRWTDEGHRKALCCRDPTSFSSRPGHRKVPNSLVYAVAVGKSIAVELGVSRETVRQHGA
jgi:hypothetical protein